MGGLVGPEIPPHILAKRKRKAEEAAAASAAAETSAPPSTSSSVSPPSADAPKKRRTVGPAPPPAPLDERPAHPPDAADDANTSDSSDDDIGPSLPPGPGGEDEELAAQARLARFASADPANNSANDGKPQRDEWMLVPPKSEDWARKVDPTKLKNRKFQSGKGARGGGKGAGEGIGALWTETPEQRAKRVRDEVMGVKKPAVQGGEDEVDKGRSVEDREAEETRRRISEFNEKNRGRSLYDDFQERGPRVEEDDPSKRAFDREKDIAGIKIGHAQKKEMLKRAADFGSRFSSGSYL